MPLGGLSVSYLPNSCAGTTYSVTALYGANGSSTWTDTGYTWNGNPAVGRDTDKVWRFDIEALAQIPQTETFSWLVGVRNIYGALTRNAIVNVVNPVHYTNSANITWAELGGSFKFAVSNSVVAFASGAALLGYQNNSVSDLSPADFNIGKNTGAIYGLSGDLGLSAKISESLSVTGRYRIYAFSDGGFTKGLANISHGPDLALSFKF
jgi:hypothetical protein